MRIHADPDTDPDPKPWSEGKFAVMLGDIAAGYCCCAVDTGGGGGKGKATTKGFLMGLMLVVLFWALLLH